MFLKKKDLDSTYERKRDIFLSESGLFCLAWCSPVPSIFLQVTWFCSFWLNKIP
jgi:hypothetical protein